VPVEGMVDHTQTSVEEAVDLVAEAALVVSEAEVLGEVALVEAGDPVRFSQFANHYLNR
jgi:hypothetical protein